MSFGLGEIFSISCAVCWAVAIILFKHSGESMSATSLNLLKNFIGFALLLPTALLIEGFKLPELLFNEWLVVFLSGFIGIALADSWYFQALRNMGAGRTAVVASLYSPFVVLLSYLMLGETLSLTQASGFILVIAGILVVVYHKHKTSIDRMMLLKGVGFAIASVFFTALGVVMMKPVLANEGFFMLVSLRLFGGIAGMLLYLFLRKTLKTKVLEITNSEHNWLNLVVASIFGTYLAMLFWLAGFKYTSANIASVLNETANIFIVIFAWVFLKEELNLRKVAGIILAFIGVVVFLGVIS